MEGSQCCECWAVGQCAWRWVRGRLQGEGSPDSYQVGASQVTLVVKNLSANAEDVRDTALIPGSGRFFGGGHGNPLQYSCLENPMDRGAWQATVHSVSQSCARLKWLSIMWEESRQHYSCPGSGVQFLTSEPRHILAVLLAPPKTCSAHLMVLLFLNSPRDTGAHPVCGYLGTEQAESRGKDWCEKQEGRTESLRRGSECPPPFLSLRIPLPWDPQLGCLALVPGSQQEQAPRPPWVGTGISMPQSTPPSSPGAVRESYTQVNSDTVLLK